MKVKKATFGAGCFWHVQAAFKKVKGVVRTTVGFMGGDLENPSYEDVCAGKTGHAEACQVEFDPDKVSYKKLLDVFWKIHDPTQLDMQGPDIGSQYRSVIFYHDEHQKDEAVKSKEKEQKKHDNKITTLIVPAKKFYRAEEYHQDYMEKKC